MIIRARPDALACEKTDRGERTHGTLKPEHIEIWQTGFLSAASDALRDMISDLARPRHLQTGETLFSQGDTGDTLYAVHSGRLEVSLLSYEGTKLTLDIMREGDLLGEISLFAPGPRTATITALSPSKVWGVRNQDVRAVLRSNPDLQMDMIELAGFRMRWMGQQYAEQVFLDVPTRLARRILHLAGSTDTTLSMSQTDLAAIVGATRETISKTLTVWKKDQIIDLGRSKLSILDRERLVQLAQHSPA